MSDEDCQRAMRGELRYTEVRPAAYNAKARLDDMRADDIDMSVLYPTQLLGIQCVQRRRIRERAVPCVQRLAVRSRAARVRASCSVPR